LKFFSERERRDEQTLSEVEPVRAIAMRAGFEVQSRAAPIPREFFKITHQRPAGSGRSFRFIRDQIIDVETAPHMGILEFAEYRNADHALGNDCHAHLAAVLEYFPHLGCVVDWQLRPQLSMYEFGSRKPLWLRYFPAGARDLHNVKSLKALQASAQKYRAPCARFQVFNKTSQPTTRNGAGLPDIPSLRNISLIPRMA